MRKAWKSIRLWLLKVLGQEQFTLKFGVVTQFRGHKNQLFLPEYQEIAEVYKRIPDLEDYFRLKLNSIETMLRITPITADGDRQRLVLQSQAEVLQDCLNLPNIAAAKAKEMLKAKNIPKGTVNV